MSRTTRRTTLWIVIISLVSITGLVGCSIGYQKGDLIFADEIINKRSICLLSSDGNIEPCDFLTLGPIVESADALFDTDAYKENIYKWNHELGIPEDDPDLVPDPYDMVLFKGGYPMTVDRTKGDQLITSAEDVDHISCYRVAYDCYSSAIDAPGSFEEYQEINGVDISNATANDINSMIPIRWDHFNGYFVDDEGYSTFLSNYPISIQSKRNGVLEELEASTPFYISSALENGLTIIPQDNGSAIIETSTWTPGLYLLTNGNPDYTPTKDITPYGHGEAIKLACWTIIQII